MQRFIDARNDKIIQAVCKYHVNKLALGPGGSYELGRRQYEDSKVENHAVDERDRKNPAIRRGNDTSLARNPCCGQQDTMEQ